LFILKHLTLFIKNYSFKILHPTTPVNLKKEGCEIIWVIRYHFLEDIYKISLKDLKDE